MTFITPTTWGRQKPPCGVGLNRAHPRSSSLRLFYSFNEGSGLRINDATGRYPTTITSVSPDVLPTWRVGNLAFDGVNRGYVPMTCPPPTGAFSMTVRYRLNAFATTMCLWGGYGIGGNRGAALSLYVSGGTRRMYFDIYGRDASSVGSRLAVTLANVAEGGSFYAPWIAQAGVWHTLTSQWNKSASMMELWADGIPCGSTSTTGIVSVDWRTYDLALGIIPNAYIAPLNGDIEFAALHDRPLTADEIRMFHAEPYAAFADEMIVPPTGTGLLNVVRAYHAIEEAA